MGKIKGVIQFTGKLGQVVGYKGSNQKRYVRERVTEVSNPRSTGQNIQRMILSTAAVGVSQLKAILSNSFENKQYGADSLAYARQLWMRMLRTSDIMSNNLNYIKKGEQRFAINPYQVSRGSLNAPAIAFIANNENEFYVSGSTNEIATNGTASQCFPSVQVGRQWTIIAIADKGTPQVAYCRFAFKSDSVPAFVVTGGGYNLNPSALDMAKVEGNWASLMFHPVQVDGHDVISIDASDMLFAEGNDDQDLTAAAALIISDKEGGLRSTSSIVINPMYTAAEFPAAVAAPTFGNVATEVNVASDVYLNNSTTEEETATPAASINPELPQEIAGAGEFDISCPTNGAIQYGVITYKLEGSSTDVTLPISSTGASADGNGVSCSIQSNDNVHTLTITEGSNDVIIEGISIVVDGVAYSF